MGRPRIYSDEERAIRRKESARRRDAKRLKNLTPEQRERGHCAVCRGEFEKRLLELDHVTPLARGGLHADENMQLLCRTCNRQKGTSDPVEFMQRKGLLL